MKKLCSFVFLFVFFALAVKAQEISRVDPPSVTCALHRLEYSDGYKKAPKYIKELLKSRMEKQVEFPVGVSFPSSLDMGKNCSYSFSLIALIDECANGQIVTMMDTQKIKTIATDFVKTFGPNIETENKENLNLLLPVEFFEKVLPGQKEEGQTFLCALVVYYVDLVAQNIQLALKKLSEREELTVAEMQNTKSQLERMSLIGQDAQNRYEGYLARQ